MPRERTLKSIFIDMVVFVGMFALLGHLSLNFWERFVIQNELSNMKTSLHSLKETITKIGYAYDNLYEELLGLAEITEKKQTPKVLDFKNEPATPQSKKKVYLHKINHKIPVEALKRTMNHTMITAPMVFNKTIQHFTMETKKNNKTQNVVPDTRKFCWSGKNKTTLTRFPLISTGVGLDTNKCKMVCPNKEHCKYKKSSSSVHHCRKGYECYNPINNWRF